MNKKILLSIIGLFVLISGIAVGLILVNQNQDFREKAAPATSISISPVTQSKKTGSNFTFSVKMDTSVNLVTGVDVRIAFDPNVIQIISMQKGTGITNLDSTITNDFNNSNGNISYAVYTTNKSKAVTGSALEILTVTAKIKDDAPVGTTRLTFGPTTSASGVDEGQNILVGMTAGNVVVLSENTSSSSPSPTNTPNTTSTPTSTPATSNTSSPTSKSTSTSIATGSSTTQTPIPLPVTGTSSIAYVGIFLSAILIVSSFFLLI